MNVLGLMSGSSLDGLDMALCSFEGEPGNLFIHHVLNCKEVAFPELIKEGLIHSKSMTSKELLKLEADFSVFLGNECKRFIDESNFKVHLICSHGHTIFHNPEDKYTRQIGNGALISQISERDVISDVRSSDIGSGGAGAPFAPLADFYLFSDYGVCINLGGISNISFQNNETITAFDVSPCNQLLNYLAKRENLEFDDGGFLASKGNVNDNLLDQLKENNKFKYSGPRAIDNAWVENIFFPMLSTYDNTNDALRTCTEFIISELIESIKHNITLVDKKQVLVTGGGALNTFLMDKLEVELGRLNIQLAKVSTKKIKFKEAILMSLFGYLRVKKIPNAFGSVTGARRDTIGGALYIY